MYCSYWEIVERVSGKPFESETPRIFCKIPVYPYALIHKQEIDDDKSNIKNILKQLSDKFPNHHVRLVTETP